MSTLARARHFIYLGRAAPPGRGRPARGGARAPAASSLYLDVMAKNPGEMVLGQEVEDSQNAETTLVLVNRRQKRLSKRDRRRVQGANNHTL